MDNETELNQMKELVTSLQKQVDSQNKLISSMQQVNQEEDDEISIKDIFLSIIRGWWAIIICTLAGAFGTMGVCLVGYVPTYSASAIMYVNNSSLSIGSTSISVSDLSASQSLVDTYAVILKTHTIVGYVVDKLNDEGVKTYDDQNYDYYDLVERVTLSAINDTEVFNVTVIDELPVNAVKIANYISEQLWSTIPNMIEGSSARVIDYAKDGDVKKISSGISTKVLIGAAVGFVVACAGAFIENYMINDVIYDSSWVTDSFKDTPLLGEIPDLLVDSHSGYYKKSYHYYNYYSNDEKDDKKETTDDKKKKKENK